MRQAFAGQCTHWRTNVVSSLSQRQTSKVNPLSVSSLFSLPSLPLTWHLSLWLQLRLSRSIWTALMQSIRLHLRLCVCSSRPCDWSTTLVTRRCNPEPYGWGRLL